MKLLLMWSFLIFTIRPTFCVFHSINKFEFGENVGRVAFTKSGSIGIFEKTKRIPIVVPECSLLKYVHVDVDNYWGPPSVQFDWDLSTVIISYRPLQFSVSEYTVIAKTVSSPHCNSEMNNIELIPLEYVDAVM